MGVFRYLGRGMDPDGGVEKNVVAQLLEQQDAVLQVAKVPGKGQDNVQDGPRHVHLGRLEDRQGGSTSTIGGEDDVSVKRVQVAQRSTTCRESSSA